MKKIYFLVFLSSLISFGQSQIGADIDGLFVDERIGNSVSLSSNGNIVAIGAPRNDENGTNSGQVRVYGNISGIWTQIGSDINGEASYDQFGFSISLSSDGSVVAIGSFLNNTGIGLVKVYKNISGTWTQIGNNIYGEAAGDFSTSLSLSFDGTILAIGAIDNDGNGTNSGHVRVFKNELGNWLQVGSDIEGESAEDFSGYCVKLSSDGSILAIGAPYNDGNGLNSGHVRVFKNELGNWIQIGNDINGIVMQELSGESISLSSDGSVVAIGAKENDFSAVNSGQVRVLKNISGIWTQIGATLFGEYGGDLFGGSVSLSSDGTILAIGAITGWFNQQFGYVCIYQNSSGTWVKKGNTINGEAIGDNFGINVNLSSNGNIIAIGGNLNSGNGFQSGHVRIFDLSAILASNTFVLNNFSIYPNPTSDFININLENNLILEKVNIYTTLGQIIRSEKSKTIDVKSLAKGNYFVEVITNQGKATKTIIIE